MSWTDFTKVEIRKINGQMGVFAREDIAAGAVIGVFDGTAEVFSVSEDGQVDWRGRDGGMSIHLKLSDGKLYAIMPMPGIDICGIDFINHSCKSNCQANAGTLVVETTRPVGRDEQLTLNYHHMDLIKMGLPCWCEDVPDNERCIL